ARGRCGDAVLLPVPPARRAPRADLEWRARTRGQPHVAHRSDARRVRAPVADDPPATARGATSARAQDARARNRVRRVRTGDRATTIPLDPGRPAHAATPHSRSRTLPGAAHSPHPEDPDGLSALLREFVRATDPAVIADQDWGTILARRSPVSRRAGKVAA